MTLSWEARFIRQVPLPNSPPQGDEMQQRLASYFSYQIREDTSIVYGEGFRIAYDAFQRHGGGMRGLSAIINSVLRSGRIE